VKERRKMSDLASTGETTGKVNWTEDNLLEWNGERLWVILEVIHPNIVFRFGVPRTHNFIDEAEVAFIQHVRPEEGTVRTTYLDRNEVINYQLGLALIVDQVFRADNTVESREVSERGEQNGAV
jgi:hypothetical protein